MLWCCAGQVPVSDLSGAGAAAGPGPGVRLRPGTGQPAQGTTNPAKSPVTGDCHVRNWGEPRLSPRHPARPGGDWLPNVRLLSRSVTLDPDFPVILARSFGPDFPVILL
jgi:hypothetical protein